MRFLIAILPLVAASIAGDVNYRPEAQRGLLVLPMKGHTLETSTTSSPQTNNNENLADETARIMEKLRQEKGSERGVYHVYLQDGRLQRVQYTSAPIRPGQQVKQQQPTSNYYNQKEQTPEILSPEFAARRGVYFVQVPQERIQALKTFYNQQASQQNAQGSQGGDTVQFNQLSAETNVKFLPLQESQIGATGFNSKYRQESASEATVRYLPIQLGEDSSQYRQQQQQAEPTGYLASVQYSQVEPIQGPVYSYKTQPLTRILRYAPVF